MSFRPAGATCEIFFSKISKSGGGVENFHKLREFLRAVAVGL